MLFALHAVDGDGAADQIDQSHLSISAGFECYAPFLYFSEDAIVNHAILGKECLVRPFS